MDKLEHAGRILARAFGYGNGWSPSNDYGTERDWQRQVKDTTPRIKLGGVIRGNIPEQSGDLSIREETEVLIQAKDSVTSWLGKRDARPDELTKEQRLARARYTPEQLAGMWSWEAAHPLTDGVRNSDPYKPREFERWRFTRIHWKRNPIGEIATAITPKVEAHDRALIALAGLPTPLQESLLLYATIDGSQWPTVERYARAALPVSAHPGIAEAMFRILQHSTDDASAKRLKMRRTDYTRMTRPALGLFDTWLADAAEQFAANYKRARRMLDGHKDAVRGLPWTFTDAHEGA